MQDTNLKTSPYFDDFDRSKNYQKVLFKPTNSVQTRELNTLQSILQNQIERFGQHTFKEGSMVIPGNIGYNLGYSCVLVQNLINGNPVENYRESLVGKIIVGGTSGVKAEVVHTISAEESEKNTLTLYVRYISGGFFEAGTQLTKFKNNEILLDEFTGSSLAVTTVRNATDYIGSVVYINPGVYFIRGFFVEVPYQKLILDQYSNTPSYKIGLIVNESIITADDDETLYDNAIGASNYVSPGADRLQITATLSKQSIFVTEDSVFIELLRLENGKEVKLVNNSVYSELERNLARRTYDESGNYAVIPFSTKIREALFDGENDGVYYPNELSNGITILARDPNIDETEHVNGNDYYVAQVSGGKAYVKGFEIDSKINQYKLVEKPRKINSLQNQGAYLNVGSYFRLGSVIRHSVSFGQWVDIRDSNNVVIGQCRSFGLANRRLYVTDLSIFIDITLDANISVSIGDYIRSSNGASAYVHGITGNTLKLRQISGKFVVSDTVSNSRNSTTAEIESIQEFNLENARTLIVASNFYAELELSPVVLSGASFTVSGGTSLTGISTRFLSEIAPKSKLRIGSSVVDVSSISPDGITVTLASSITNATYYNISKLVAKIEGQKPLIAQASSYPVQSSSDYLYSTTNVDTVSLTTQTEIILSKTSPVLASSVIVTTSTSGPISATIEQLSANSVRISGLSNNTTYYVYYQLYQTNASRRTKIARTFNALEVSKVKNLSNTVYGTRISDEEISLKFPDVYKIHAIHESLDDGAVANETLFDLVVLNDASQIVNGDIIETGTIRFKVISVSGNNLRVIYISSAKLENGSNLARPVRIVTNPSLEGRFITSSSIGTYKDITANFSLVKSDEADIYRVSKLVRKFNRPVPQRKFIVIFDRLEPSLMGNDFFTIDSYSGIEYSRIPNSYDGRSYSDIIDFRYFVNWSSTSGTAGTLASPFVESSSISPFDYRQNTILSASTKFIYPETIFSLDYDFYMGRIDHVYITETGSVEVIKGNESVTPIPPASTDVGLLIATINIPPYLKKITDASVAQQNIKNYTMKDIGSIERRLAVIEQTTSLSLLESNTNNLTILDESGTNRFKNGFVVDNFSTTNVSDLMNPDFSVSVDTQRQLIRPYPYVNNITFQLDENSNVEQNGNLITLPYTEVVYAEQPYASRLENLQPFETPYFAGNLFLNPQKDVWFDTNRTLTQSQSIDFTDPIRFLFDNSSASGDVWGEWENVSSSFRNDGSTVFDDRRTGVNNSLSSFSQNIQVGDTIQGFSDQLFCRSIIIDVTSTALKPSTKFNLFIDDINVNQYFFPKLLTSLVSSNSIKFIVGEQIRIYSGTDTNDYLIAEVTSPFDYTTASAIGTNFAPSTGYSTTSSILAIKNIRSRDNTIINPKLISNSLRIIGQTSGAVSTIANKSDVLSNSDGSVHAFVLLPPQTFRTGILKFELKDIDSTSISLSSNSSSEFYTQGTQVNLTSSVVSVTTPQIVTVPISESRVRVVTPPPPAAGRDPLAQSFFVEEAEGVFLTSIDLYFYSKDVNLPVTVEIRTLQNGQPTNTVVPFSTVTVPAANVPISNNATAATKFTFPSPVYLSSQTEYCFVVKSNSKDYHIWVSRLSEQDITTDFFIDKQPYVGVLFKSANQSTWESDQYEDIKFRMNRAKFAINSTYTATLKNAPVTEVSLGSDSLRFVQNSSVVKITHPNHGMNSTVGNYVTFSGITSDKPNTRLNSTINSSVTSISVSPISGVWNVIGNAPISVSNPGYIKIDDEIIGYTGVTSNAITGLIRGAAGTNAASHTANSIVECYNLNGIPLQLLNTTHPVVNVNSLDEYEIVTTGIVANATMYGGGDSIKSSKNIQYEIIEPKLNYMTPEKTSVSISMNSYSGTSIGSADPSFVQLPPEGISNGIENELVKSRLILSPINENDKNIDSSLNLNLLMSSTSDLVSPVVDISGSSAITISNRINKVVDQDGNLDISSELLPYGGLHAAYVTKKITIETPSTSNKIYFDAIRQAGVDFKVFIKYAADGTNPDFNTINYVEVPAISYPTSDNNNQYRAFEYEIVGLPAYTQWSIKIIMIGTDQSIIPTIKNFRSIALAS